jgi:AbrB family looped-hinge helix DNA binding protein
MSKASNLTVKGQVTIPKDVRDALGLKPGEPVAFEKNASGDYVVRRGRRSEAERKKRIDAALRAIDEAVRRHPPQPSELTTEDYMALIREPVPEPPGA